MRLLLSLILIFGPQWAVAQDDEPLDEIEVGGDMIEDDYDDADEEEEAPRQPPPPSNRFRTPSKRFGGSAGQRPNFNRSGNRSGGGEDRLGQTEGKVQFELVDPPVYFKKKNRPYLKPPNSKQ